MALQRGETLHDDVPANRWCITWRDFGKLRNDLAIAVAVGEISPTEKDDFDPDDRRDGPNMYSVNEQFIKPRTRAAGGMSYALMLYPEGLPCDLFISHAWQEGAFELIDKLQASWPRGNDHAWCCVLANPQNLNINHMLRTPHESPFAVALRSATHMLVVSNKGGSVYSRIWCVYEIYIAYNADKTILMARAPIDRDMKRQMPSMLIVGVVAFAINRAIFATHTTEWFLSAEAKSVFNFIVLVATGMVIFWNSRWWRFWNHVGIVAIILPTGGPYHPFMLAMSHKLGCQHTMNIFWLEYAYRSCIIFFFIVSELDRLRDCALKVSERQLRRGYTGSVTDAVCTDENDKERIFGYLGDQIEEVDKAVNDLIATGMSTESLRRASELDVRTAHVARFHHAPMAFLICFAVIRYLLSAYCETIYIWIRAGFLVGAITWVGVYLSLPLDGKAFACAASSKLFAVGELLNMFATLFGYTNEDAVGYTSAILSIIFAALAVVVSTARIHRVARVPIIGRTLAVLLIGRGLKELLFACDASEVKSARTFYGRLDSTSESGYDSSDSAL